MQSFDFRHKQILKGVLVLLFIHGHEEIMYVVRLTRICASRLFIFKALFLFVCQHYKYKTTSRVSEVKRRVLRIRDMAGSDPSRVCSVKSEL